MQIHYVLYILQQRELGTDDLHAVSGIVAKKPTILKPVFKT